MKLALLLLVSFVASLAARSETINAEDVEVREEPFLAARVVGRLEKGELLSVTRKTDFIEKIDGVEERWYFVAGERATGWAHGRFLAELFPENYGSFVFPLYYDEASRGEAPGIRYFIDYDFADAQFIRVLSNGARLPIPEDKIDFAYLRTDGLVAWESKLIEEDRGQDRLEGETPNVDIVIKTPASSKRIYAETFDIVPYPWGRVSEIRLSERGSHVVVLGENPFTWLAVYSASSGEPLATGFYDAGSEYERDGSIRYIKTLELVHGKEGALAYLRKNKVARTIDGRKAKKAIESHVPFSSPIYCFGALQLLDLRSGAIKSEEIVLYCCE